MDVWDYNNIKQTYKVLLIKSLHTPLTFYRLDVYVESFSAAAKQIKLNNQPITDIHLKQLVA